MKIKIWTLASDDDCGTRTEVFTTEREAEEAWVNAAVPDEDENKEARERLERDGFNAVIDWAENEQMRDPMDTYTVEEHTVEVAFTPSEIATILYALRQVQDDRHESGETEHLNDAPPLTDAQLDSLCERFSS